MTNDLYERIFFLVRAVPSGKVTTYGQLGAMCGIRDSRTVGEAMNASPADVPWQRVINARGMISLQGATGARQRALLEQEGVAFDENGHVDFAEVGWTPAAEWLAANGYTQPPPLVKKDAETEGTEGEQLSLF